MRRFSIEIRLLRSNFHETNVCLYEMAHARKDHTENKLPVEEKCRYLTIVGQFADELMTQRHRSEFNVSQFFPSKNSLEMT